ncbi:MAG: TIGR00725 family protein [Candidatus Marinimicrobia bacterium CG08_land_8_20_14_0_20_45_22]|nr:MAG: TIGR00725 family protein [Candidatus Marinimicrobia bacterium CG08_land_8_20_14_0_20_45_22]
MKENYSPISRSKETKRQPIIAVIGGRECDEEIWQLAYLVGKGIAERGAILICGGKNGVMEAACHGAFDADGLTIGIMTGGDDSEANPFVKIVIPTGIGVARNSIIVRACDAAIAVGGKYGTLSEIAYCLQIGKRVCSLKSWAIDGVVQVKTPEEALGFAFADIANPSGSSGFK